MIDEDLPDTTPPVPIENTFPEVPFKVRVAYVTQTQREEEYIGNFRARNGDEALRLGRDFVIKYKRPSSITATELQFDPLATE